MTKAQYNQCVDAYADRLYRYVLKSLGDAELAQDIIQDTFLKTWEKIDHIQFDTAKAFLFKVAYNTMIDAIRKQKPSVSTDRFHPVGYSANQPNYQLKEVLDEALAKIPATQRTVILLRDYEGYTYEEVANITGLSIDQVKVYIFRGRKALKDLLVSVENVL